MLIRLIKKANADIRTKNQVQLASSLLRCLFMSMPKWLLRYSTQNWESATSTPLMVILWSKSDQVSPRPNSFTSVLLRLQSKANKFAFAATLTRPGRSPGCLSFAAERVVEVRDVLDVVDLQVSLNLDRKRRMVQGGFDSTNLEIISSAGNMFRVIVLPNESVSQFS